MPNNADQVLKNVLPASVLSEVPGDFLFENPIQPETHNNLTNNKFRFVMTRTPTMTYFCQRANIPSLGFGTSIQSNPTGVTIKRPGTSYVYEDLQVGFAVDENMKNWIEIHNWMLDLGISHKSPGLYEKLTEKQKVCSAYLLVLNSAYRPIICIKYRNVYPTFLSGVEFDSSLTDTDAVIATATFAYTHYEIEPLTTLP
jgi:hypothetical protein